MGMKHYSEEFRADAVALYLSDPARTYASVARDLGVNAETLRVGPGCPARWGGCSGWSELGSVDFEGERSLGRRAGRGEQEASCTTIPEPDARPVPDLLKRDFTATSPNQRYVGDITYLPIGDGKFLYLATVIDLCSRRLAGWSIADHMRTELIVDALDPATRTRGGTLDAAIFHSDNGAQYCSKDFERACRRLGVTRSRGAVGTSADNAAAESINALLKRETLQGAHRWSGAREAHLAVFKWVTRYNTTRRHSRLGQTSPINYEKTAGSLTAVA